MAEHIPDRQVHDQSEFDQAYDFVDGLAAVQTGSTTSEYGSLRDDGKWGYIDNTGKYAINPQFGRAASFGSNGLAAVNLGYKYNPDGPNTQGKWGFIDKNGKYAVNPQFDGCQLCFSYTYGIRELQRRTTGGTLIAVNVGYKYNPDGPDVPGKWGYIDQSGKYVINPQYAAAEDFSPYSKVALVLTSSKKGRWKFIGPDGKEISTGSYDSAYPYKNGFARVQVGAKWGYLN